MAVQAVRLPNKPEDLARLLRMHAERERARYSYRRAMWMLAWYYLNGARRFDIFDPYNGRISPHYLDRDGNVEFQSNELLAMIDKTVARIASMDLRPKVMRQGSSLRMIRERAAAQVVADSLISDNHLSQVVSTFAHHFVALGCCGIQGHLVDVPTIGLTADLEVVHPREVYPFPALHQDFAKKQGIMRQRVIPVEFLEDRFGKSFITKKLDGMEYWVTDPGNTVQDPNLDEPGDAVRNPFDGRSISSGISAGSNVLSTKVARVRELWLDGPRGTCSRYIVTCGIQVLLDEDYTDRTVYCPLTWARFMDTGTFYGAGMFDLLFGISREAEKLMKSLFNNIRDIDKYGVLVLPAGAFNERTSLREVGKGLRVMAYQPDPLNEKFNPMTISPVNAGDVPGKVAQFAREVMHAISPIQDLIQEKGRIDSATGLQFLDEQITRAMTNPSIGIQRCFGDLYQSIVSSAVTDLVKFPKPIPVTNLTMDLAGAVINMENGSVSFEQNPIPHVSHLNFGVREVSPRSEVARKQEALGLLKAGLMDPDSFKLFALKEGLDFAMWIEEERSAYEMGVQNILVLYGNGNDPGQVVTTQHNARPDIQLRLLSAFMTSPTMAVASPEVQDAFANYRESLMQFMGATLPPQVPSPEMAAMAMGPQNPANPAMPGMQGPPM